MIVSPSRFESSRVPVTRLVVSFIAALSLLFGPLAFAPAQAATAFAISGTIVGEGDFGPIEGVSVELEVYDAESQSYGAADDTYTDEEGEYGFTSVAGGETYRLHVNSAEGFAPAHLNVGKLTGNKPMGTTILELAGSISGTVIEEGSPLPIEGADVSAYRMNGTAVDLTDGAFETTDEDGAFSLDGLAAGVYQVKIEDYVGNHLMKVFNTVPVSKGTNTDLTNIELARGAEFTGTVLDEQANPIENAAVHALRVVNGVADYSNPFEANIDPSGTYTIGGLPAGDYKIQFTANDEAYFDEFYNDKPTEAAADVQRLVLGDTKPLGTTVLEKTATISGSIKSSSNQLLGDILVEAFPVKNGVIAAATNDYAYTDDDGLFELSPLHAGTYRLKVTDGLHVYKTTLGPTVTIVGGDAKSVGVIKLDKLPIPKKAATVKVSGKGGKKKATLTITVKASGVTPTGKVKILLGSKTLKTVTLKKGKATVTLTKQKKGNRVYKVIYSGDSKVLAKSVTTSKIKIK